MKSSCGEIFTCITTDNTHVQQINTFCTRIITMVIFDVLVSIKTSLTYRLSPCCDY